MNNNNHNKPQQTTNKPKNTPNKPQQTPNKPKIPKNPQMNNQNINTTKKVGYTEEILKAINNETIRNLADIKWEEATNNWDKKTIRYIIDSIHNQRFKLATIDVMSSEWEINGIYQRTTFKKFLVGLRKHIAKYDCFDIEAIKKQSFPDIVKLKEEVETIKKQLSNSFQKTLPDELNTEEARTYFDRARELGLIDNNYNWLKGKQALACFCKEMSLMLKLGKGERLSWKPFEALFGIGAGKLRGNYNDTNKKPWKNRPSDIKLVDEVFKST